MDIEVLFQGLREFGLAVVLVLAGAASSFLLIKSMRDDYKELLKRNKELQDQILELSKSAIQTVSDLTKITEEFSPAVSALGTAQKEQLKESLGGLREHLDHKLALLHNILDR
jgi:predicted  nucleic acid-binding Zn-ribbon protein